MSLKLATLVGLLAPIISAHGTVSGIIANGV